MLSAGPHTTPRLGSRPRPPRSCTPGPTPPSSCTAGPTPPCSSTPSFSPRSCCGPQLRTPIRCGCCSCSAGQSPPRSSCAPGLGPPAGTAQRTLLPTRGRAVPPLQMVPPSPSAHTASYPVPSAPSPGGGGCGVATPPAPPPRPGPGSQPSLLGVDVRPPGAGPCAGPRRCCGPTPRPENQERPPSRRGFLEPACACAARGGRSLAGLGAGRGLKGPCPTYFFFLQSPYCSPFFIPPEALLAPSCGARGRRGEAEGRECTLRRCSQQGPMEER